MKDVLRGCKDGFVHASPPEQIFLVGLVACATAGLSVLTVGAVMMIAKYVEYCLHHSLSDVFGNTVLGLIIAGVLIMVIGLFALMVYED